MKFSFAYSHRKWSESSSKETNIKVPIPGGVYTADQTDAEEPEKIQNRPKSSKFRFPNLTCGDQNPVVRPWDPAIDRQWQCRYAGAVEK